MNRFRLGAAVAFALSVTAAAVIAQGPDKPATPAADPNKAAMDKPVKPFVLKDVAKELKPSEKDDAAIVNLETLKGKKNVVLFFMSEGCSVTWRYEKRVGQLMKEMAKNDVAFYGVRCSATDSCEGIKKFAETRNFAMPILNDEKGEMTKFYGVRNTPAFVVVDKKGALRYFGGFDDHPDEAQVKKPYLKEALVAVLDNKEVPTKQTRALG